MNETEGREELEAKIAKLRDAIDFHNRAKHEAREELLRLMKRLAYMRPAELCASPPLPSG